MKKPKPVRDAEAAGWTEMREEWEGGHWIGLPPGGNGGVTMIVYEAPNVHDRSRLAEAFLCSIISSGAVIGLEEQLSKTAVAMADAFIEALND